MLFDPDRLQRHDPAMAVQAAPLQRSRGEARVGFRADDGTTRLARLRQAGSSKVRFPASHDGRPFQAVVINTSGGLTGGDCFDLAFEADDGADAAVVTQACEKVYRAGGTEPARVATRLNVGKGARLAWLPQETIVFDGGRLDRSLDIDLAGDAHLVAVESFILGRSAMREAVSDGSLRDTWRIRRDGKLIFADAMRIDAPIDAAVARPGVLGGRTAFSTIVAVGTAPNLVLEPLRRALGDDGAASAMDDVIVARLAVDDALTLRARLVDALFILNDGRPLPRVWDV